jgi:ribosomal protein S18 acetylase RimI-like enzyme
MTVRQARPEDAAALASFAATAFWDTYREIDDPEDIADYVQGHFHPDVMSGVIADRRCTALLAEVCGELAGYAILRQAPSPSHVGGPDPIEVWRFYLGKAFIGRGLGVALMRAVRDEARALGAATLWLGVYDRNARAVAFYERLGFRKVGGKEVLFGGKVYIDPVYAAPVGAATAARTPPCAP